MNIQVFKKILFFSFIACPFLSWSQQTCSQLEEKMQLMAGAGSTIVEAEVIYDEYLTLACADMLLAYNFMGHVNYNNSNLDKAKEILLRGEIEFFDKEIEPEQFSVNQMYTALIFIVEKDYESALYYLSKAEEYALKSSDKTIHASVYQNMALLHLEIDELEKAEEYSNKAINTGGLDSYNIGYTYQNLAFLYFKQGNSEKSLELINKTKEIWNSLEFSKGKYLLSFIEAKLSIRNKEFTNGLSQLEYGRSVYQEENKLLLGENYLIEAQIQDSLGNNEAMLIAIENAILDSDDLSEEQLKKAISDLSELQDDSKTNVVLADLVSRLKLENVKQKEIDLNRNKVKDKETKEDESIIETRGNYLVLLGAGLMLLFVLFLRIIKQKGDIQDLNQNLKNSNLEIENQVNRLKQKNEELEQFAYVASHDLKSPVRTISSFAGLLKSRYSDDKANEFLDIITKSAQNMSAMISDLLKHTTLDQELNIQDTDLKTMIEETLKCIDTEIIESNTSIIVDDSCSQTLPCDKVVFSNVIQNLISNAITYCKEDVPPEIKISAVKANEQITITISDNGIGINEANTDQIFQMFNRLKAKDVEGTGIGLATCKKIIEKHGGTISVNSTFGVGSEFIIIMPIEMDS